MEPDLLADALAALGQAFMIVEERRSTRRRTWLDTFDWRLYNAGLILEQERTRQGTRLILTGTDGRPRADQEDQVNDAIAALVAPRALLPVAAVTTTRRTFRLQNSDAKTVARLVAEDAPFRMEIADVRGYPGHARRARALLAPAQPAPGPYPDTATRRPGDYSGKIDAPITAGMPAAQAVATIGLRLLDTLEQNLDGVLRDIDTEFLHDLRVAVRRTRSLIKLLGDALPDQEEAGAFAAEFKWLGDLTTPVRDLDVHLLGFDDLSAQLVAARREDLEPFRDFLRRSRAREFRRLTRGLRSQRFRAITAGWRKVLESVPAEKSRPTVAALARRRTARAVSKLLRDGSAITADSAPEALHDLRKRAKELRYLLEFFAPVQDRGDLVGDLKKLQDCLGEFQDSQVQREELAGFADALLADAAIPRKELVATLLAMGEISAGLAHRQIQAREDFARRFARFARTAEQ